MNSILSKRQWFLLAVVVLLSCGHRGGQTQNIDELPVGGSCEGCEAIYEYDDVRLDNRDTLPGYFKNDQRLHLSGTVYDTEDKPAANVLLYLYHTDNSGRYTASEGATGWARKHGALRSWLKTDSTGQYHLYTGMPGAYPSGIEPPHIHIVVKQPGYSEYYIDGVVFEKDFGTTSRFSYDGSGRGGSGLVALQTSDSISYEAVRDIFLEKNIPGF